MLDFTYNRNSKELMTDFVLFAITIHVKLVEAEHLQSKHHVHLVMEARLLTYFSKALELRMENVLIVVQRANLMMEDSAKDVDLDHQLHAHRHPPL